MCPVIAPDWRLSRIADEHAAIVRGLRRVFVPLPPQGAPELIGTFGVRHQRRAGVPVR